MMHLIRESKIDTQSYFPMQRGGVVLLHDERNPAFLRSSENGVPQGGLWPFLIESVPAGLRHWIWKMTAQGVVQAIEENGRHDNWIYDFKEE